MESSDPLTKARLFASREPEQWTEIGLGVVSIVTETLPANLADGGHLTSGGKRGKASDEEVSTKLAARLQMFSLDSPSELLLSSYISLDDIYTIQSDTILLWYDEAVGNDIACSFNSKDGCDAIYGQIKAFQQAERLRRVQDERLPIIADKFLVHPRNLPAILDAAEAQNKRLGLYVKDDATYFRKLVQLFHASQGAGDTATMELVSKIVLALLQPPYSSDGKIVSQFVEEAYVDDCIDILQYALGRRDKASGFVSFAERRATFHDPCGLPDDLKSRIHVLYSCGFLKDLIPLVLEPADMGCGSLLSSFALRYTMGMLTEVCTSPTILPPAFTQAVEGVQLDTPASDPAAIEPSKVAHIFELAAFVGEIAKTVKNAMIGIDMRTEIFSSLVHAGLLPFLTAVLECALRYYVPPASYPTQQWAVQPPRAVQLVCDTLYGCATHFPECIEDLVAESSATPHRCLLQLLLHATTVVRTSAEAQSIVDAVQCCGVGVPLTVAMFGDNAQLEARRHEVLRYWIEGNVVDRPPLFHLASYLVSALTGSGASGSGGATTAASSDQQLISECCATHNITNSSRNPGVGCSSALQLSVVTERQVVYGLRFITAIVSKIDATRCNSFVEVMTLSKLIPALATTLEQPLRRLANLQSSVTSFIAAVLERREIRLVPLVASSNSLNLLHAALQLFLQCGHRDNILSSSLGHLLCAVCDGVHREKVSNISSSCVVPFSGSGSLGPSPFVTMVPNEDSLSKAEQNTTTADTPVRVFESVAAAVLAQFGERLAVAAPVLHRRLLKALEETPDQAQQSERETSSIASSMERSAMPSFADFDAAAIDFGLEPPLRTPSLDAVTEERLSSLTRSLTASDEDEDPLADLSSINADSDYEECEEETATTTGSAEALGSGSATGLTDALPGGAATGAGRNGSGGGGGAATSAVVHVGAATSAPPLSSTSSPPALRGHTSNGTTHSSPLSPSVSPLSPNSVPVAAVESIDPPSGRGSLLEDEENRLPRRLSVKRSRTDTDKLENEEEEDEAEVKRMKAEESAA